MPKFSFQYRCKCFAAVYAISQPVKPVPKRTVMREFWISLSPAFKCIILLGVKLVCHMCTWAAYRKSSMAHFSVVTASPTVSAPCGGWGHGSAAGVGMRSSGGCSVRTVGGEADMGRNINPTESMSQGFTEVRDCPTSPNPMFPVAFPIAKSGGKRCHNVGCQWFCSVFKVNH